jgi:signal peptidase I
MRRRLGKIAAQRRPTYMLTGEIRMVGMIKRHFRIVLMLLFGAAVLPSYLRAYKITTPSETPSINIGDSILVNETAYTLRLPYSHVALFRTGSPKRGDMVLVQLPGRTKVAPKRVLGLPGETVEFRENRVVVDGRTLPLQPLNRGDFNWVAPANRIGSDVFNEDGHWISFTPGQGRCRNHEPVSLAPHQYFVVGDNRDESLDSRIWGPISEERILGKVMMTYARSK